MLFVKTAIRTRFDVVVVVVGYCICYEIRAKSLNYVNFPAFNARTKMTCSLFTSFIIITS